MFRMSAMPLKATYTVTVEYQTTQAIVISHQMKCLGMVDYPTA